MKPFKIIDPGRIRQILRTFACLDEIRWFSSENYNLINYFTEDLSADEKLLTHWLCYIMDRQMPFRRIWEVGGYVISRLVRSYARGDYGSLRRLLESYVRQDGKKISLECPLENANARLESYGITGPTVPFASRYMTDDLVRIYRTLVILDSTSKRSLSRFIASILHDHDDHWQNIRRMASGLNDLSYAAGGAFSVDRIDSALDKMEHDAATFTLEPDTSKKLFGRKRLWCSLRDYLKSPEFNLCFVRGLQDVGSESAEAWERSNPTLKKALGALELPGDVWNNADVFRKGLFSPYLCNVPSSWDMPHTIREVYNVLAEGQEMDFYPEQLDITFDFVPRMCQTKMCQICLFGGGIHQLCHHKAGYLCPVVLVACGYKHECSPDACTFRKNSVKGFCHSAAGMLNS